MTPAIYGLMSCAPWWERYTASALDGQQAYFTTLLYRRDAVSSAQPFELRRFANSCMGARPRRVAVLLI